MRVGQVLERVGVIDGRALVGDFHLAPAFRRREHFLKGPGVDNFLPKSEDSVSFIPMPGPALAMSIAMIPARPAVSAWLRVSARSTFGSKDSRVFALLIEGKGPHELKMGWGSRVTH